MTKKKQQKREKWSRPFSFQILPLYVSSMLLLQSVALSTFALTLAFQSQSTIGTKRTRTLSSPSNHASSSSVAEDQSDDINNVHVSNSNQQKKSAEKKKRTFRLPIFPLRKRVKFPTENIQLTLWEERYKLLAQSVLNQSCAQGYTNTNTNTNTNIDIQTNNDDNYHHMFGIVYSSHKPQIVVTNGNVMDPITPMIDIGDIGVLCLVKEYTLFIDNEIARKRDNFPLIQQNHDSDDDNNNYNNATITFATANNSKKKNIQGDNHDHDVVAAVVEDLKKYNKMQLIGYGIERFRVDNIIHKGYNIHKKGPRDKSEMDKDSLFIMVDATIIHDNDDVDNDVDNDDESLVQYRERLMQQSQSWNDLYHDVILNHPFPNVSSFDQHTTSSSNTNSSRSNMDSRSRSRSSTDSCNHEDKVLELWSFAMLSTLESKYTAKEMLNMLSCTSIKERLQFLNDSVGAYS